MKYLVKNGFVHKNKDVLPGCIMDLEDKSEIAMLLQMGKITELKNVPVPEKQTKQEKRKLKKR